MFENSGISKIFDRADLTELSYDSIVGESLYHYCNNDVLWSILENKSIWLSSIFEMNDSEELRWGRRLLLDIINNRAHRFSKGFRDFLFSNMLEFDSHCLAVLCSFSKEGDILSQWRAYADDAQGFSIGFDARSTQDLLPINMKEVSYNEKAQRKLLLNSLNSFNRYWKKSRKFSDSELIEIFGDALACFSADIASLKHPCFFEEKEVRGVHLLVRKKGAKDKWDDASGHNIHGSTEGVPVLSRKRGNKNITYISLPLVDEKIISEIVIGPKNKTSVEELEVKLMKIGFGHVRVRKSELPYR